ALVISLSASGRTRLALASVVVILPCSNNDVARFANINRSCAGDPPRRVPLVGVGIGSPRSASQPQDHLQLLRLCVVLAVVVASVRKARRGLRTPGLACTSTTVGGGSSRGVESRRAVLQRQAETGELHLHLVYRLSAEVTDVEQVGLTPGHQLANRVDSLTLQAVVRPH